MKNRLECFPIIDDGILKEMREDLNIDFKASYTRDYIIKNITLKCNKVDVYDKEYRLDLDNSQWQIDSDNLNINIKIEMKNIKKLYDKYNLARNTTKLAVGVNISCKKAMIRKTIHIADIQYEQDKLNTEYSHEILPNMLKGSVEVEFFIYVKEIDNIIDNQNFANITGAILGIIQTNSIMLEGDGSLFPIVDVEDFEENNGLLWRIQFDEDCLELDIDEGFLELRMNKKHSVYKNRKLEEITNKNIDIYTEILSGFIVGIILKIDISEINDSEYDTGTIGKFIQYCVDIYEIKDSIANNYIQLSEVIRKKIYQVLSEKYKRC